MSKNLPQHIAIVMDGNGRWAKMHKKNRVSGHKEGLKSARVIIDLCAKKKIEVLSLFAFSSENWERPAAEVSALMDLFATAITNEIEKLHKNNICCRFIGDLSRFSPKLRQLMHDSQTRTASNTGMTLLVAVNYGGQWDITHATQQLAKIAASGELEPEAITTELIQQHLSFADLPNPDLFIRTSGELRISNFFLWQLAYTELYFTDIFWPDFREQALNEAIACYQTRQRRFGATGDQLEQQNSA